MLKERVKGRRTSELKLRKAFMEMKLRKKKDKVVVSFVGHIDMDLEKKFRSVYKEHLQQQKIIFNMQELSFVGSVGISDFFKTLRDVTLKKRDSLKFIGLKSEFRKMLSVNMNEGVEFFESEAEALSSFEKKPSFEQELFFDKEPSFEQEPSFDKEPTLK